MYPMYVFVCVNLTILWLLCPHLPVSLIFFFFVTGFCLSFSVCWVVFCRVRSFVFLFMVHHDELMLRLFGCNLKSIAVSICWQYYVLYNCWSMFFVTNFFYMNTTNWSIHWTTAAKARNQTHRRHWLYNYLDYRLVTWTE